MGVGGDGAAVDVGEMGEGVEGGGEVARGEVDVGCVGG